MLRIAMAIALTLALLACSDDEGASLDGAIGSDASPGDGALDPCFREADDRRNSTDPEATGLAVGVGRVAICGAIEVDHPGGVFLDVDQYELAVTVNGPAVVRLTAPGAGALTRVDMIVKNTSGRLAVARVHAGLGIAVLPLAAGTHVIAVEAQGPAASPVPYQIEIVDDDPMARCAIGASPVPDYQEAADGAAARGNDVVSVRTSPAVLTNLTASTADGPEPTGLAVSIGGRKTIVGTSADVAPVDDPYHDRDTFAIYTGQSINLLEVRAVWPGAVADLDLFVFEADRADDPMGRPVELLGGELLVTAVKPATPYWIWVGGANGASRYPAAYAIAICGHEVAIGAGRSY